MSQSSWAIQSSKIVQFIFSIPWLSKVIRDCNGFPSLRTVIVLKKLPYPFDQLEARLKPHVTCSLGFSRASNSVLALPRVLVGLLKFLLSDWTLQLPRCFFDDIQYKDACFFWLEFFRFCIRLVNPALHLSSICDIFIIIFKNFK